MTILWNEVSTWWNEVSTWWNEVTKGWNEVAVIRPVSSPSDVTLHKSERGREETKISVICYSSCASKALYSENLLFFLGFCQRLLLFYAKLFHIRKIPSLLFFVNTQSFSTFNNGFGILISIHSHQFLSSIGF